MKKTLSYRLLRFGAVPGEVRSVLEQEGIVVLDEGIPGRFIAKHVNGPGKRYRNRLEGFSGWLAITRARVICYTYWKRQMNISSDDPGIQGIYVDAPLKNRLKLSFESSNFREGWDGLIVFHFDTDKASLFRDALLSIGAKQGDSG